jgi:hypothetical protein
MMDTEEPVTVSMDSSLAGFGNWFSMELRPEIFND